MKSIVSGSVKSKRRAILLLTIMVETGVTVKLNDLGVSPVIVVVSISKS